jgi:hypothetical protein
MSRNEIKAEEFDRLFDEGRKDITKYLDLKAARRPGLEIKRINVDFPAWMVAALDEEAAHLGVSRQALIKFVMNAHLRHTE